MKAIILAGGLGTRISEETTIRPKPMVEIGGQPILWHIMKLYSAHGINDFIICLGYKGHVIKRYFLEYAAHLADLTVDLSTGTHKVHAHTPEPWRVTLIDTGADSGTGGRLKQALQHVGNVDISAAVAFHRNHGRLATVTATRPPKRFGVMTIDGDRVTDFHEKPD